MGTQQNWSLLVIHDHVLTKKGKRNTLVQRMPQWHKLDSKVSCEMKVKSFIWKKVQKANLKFRLFSLCCAGGHQKQI